MEISERPKRRVLAKGTTYQLIAKSFLIFSGYIMHVFLGRYLGPQSYGAVGIIVSLLFIIRIISFTGLGQTIMKFTAEDMKNHLSVFRSASRIQMSISITISLLLIILAKPLANSFFHDPALIPYIQLSSLIIPIISRFNIYQASLNGLRLFGKQAIGTFAFAFSRVLLVIIFVLLGFAVYGVIMGFIISSIISMAVVIFLYPATQGNPLNYFPYKKMIYFGLNIMGSVISITVIINMDLLLLKSLLMDNTLVGYYNSAVIFSRIPYELFSVFAMTILPSIAMARGLGDNELVNKYIRQSIRYVLILILPCAILISLSAKQLIITFYSNRYEAAGEPLSVLIWGLSFISLFFVMTSIINALGKPNLSMLFAFILVPIDVVLNLILIPKYHLIGAALSTTITSSIGVAMVSSYLFTQYGSFVKIRTLLRIGLACLVMAFVMKLSLEYYSGWLVLFAIYVLGGLTYIAMLVLTTELNREDFKVARSIFTSGSFGVSTK